MDPNKEIRKLLRESAWLHQNEVAFLRSLRRQSSAGRKLSDKQIATAGRIWERVQKRKEPKFFQGGAPGLGKRR